jgi:hypothetical protein
MKGGVFITIAWGVAPGYCLKTFALLKIVNYFQVNFIENA